jgi:two-component system response regulator AtoC
MNNVLVVDDDAAVGTVLAAILKQAGMACTNALSGAQALEALEKRPFDAVVTDLRMPGMDGMDLLAKITDAWPETPVVMLTAHGTVDLAVEAMKRGAADFAQKPFDREEILFVIEKAIARGKRQAAAVPDARATARELVGSSDVMKEVDALIERAARSTATVLVLGESGTGKELAARAIHERSARKGKPFVKLHCGALPDTLLESELFGYEKGAFTGAVGRKPGRVELAEGGTLFLDEIGDITPATQVKLLRVLQERELERLGGTQTIKVDVRFVAATHRDLAAMVAEGDFREDLYYRLNVIPLTMPPLRARPDDVDALVERFAAAHGPGVRFAPEAVARLRAERWPGNVRQLQNFVERLVVLSDGPRITLEDVEREIGRRPAFQAPETEGATGASPPGVNAGAGAGGRASASLDERVHAAEREALKDALERAKGNRTLAARLLGVSRRTLYNKLEEHGMG